MIDNLDADLPIGHDLTVALRAIRDGDLDAADLAIDQARVTHADPAMILAMRGALWMRKRNWGEAETYFRAALDLDPNNIMLRQNLGMARFEGGSYKAAIDDFREVLLRNPSIGHVWHKLGACHTMLQNHCEGLACMDHAVAIDPDNPECHHGMATVLSHYGIEDGALFHARRAQELLPGYAHAEALEAFTLLRTGRLLEGWPKFEARWRLPSPVAPWDYKGAPLYTGSLDGLKGKRVLLRSEQGFGDSIQFARYVPLVAELASEVWVETHANLERLFQVLPARILLHGRDDVPDFDVQTSLMSLPLLFGTTQETVPPPIRYASSKRDLGVKSGVCWAGGSRPENPSAHFTDKRRSLSEAQFAPIIYVLRPCLVLQREELSSFGVSDWQGTADIVGGLDLVVTVDTAIAHLAASLGVRTLMLSRRDRCWRWPANGATPWYPTMTVFSQPILGQWTPVIERVVKTIGELK
jgi:tetratricopeptide (TPR) repeat protein